MKVAFAIVFALALFASTGTALAQSEEPTMTDSVACEDGGIESEREAGRPCTEREGNIAADHCWRNHASFYNVCKLTSCVVRNGWIVYTWSGYTLAWYD